MASDDRDARALLATFIAAQEPDPQRRRHNWNATLTRLDEDPLADAPPVRRVHASRTWLLAAAGVVVIASALLGSRALIEAQRSSHRSQASAIDATVPAPETAPQHVPEPVTMVAPRESSPAVAVERPIDPPPASAAPRRPTPRSQARTPEPEPDVPIVVTPERLALETRLLARVREAAAANDDARAIALLQQHAREFPDGAMVEDRRAWLAIVQCRSLAPQGQRSAAAFLAAHPRSPYAERVRTECGEIE